MPSTPVLATGTMGNSAGTELVANASPAPPQTWLPLGPAPTSPLARQRTPAPRQAGLQESRTGGIHITGQDVSPTAIEQTERIVRALTGHREDIQERLSDAKTRVVVISSEQALTDVPELNFLHNTLTTDGCRHWQDVRGSGGTPIDDEWIVSMPEENLVQTQTGRPDLYREDHNVGLHELAHTILMKGVSRQERERVAELYAAQSGSQFTDDYGASNVDEYFAQSTGAFFGMIADEGPEWLQLQDPDMYEMLTRIYGSPDEAVARADGTDTETTPGENPVA